MIRHHGPHGLRALVCQASYSSSRSAKPCISTCITSLRAGTRTTSFYAQQVRGKKTRTVVNLADLPQGLVQSSLSKDRKDESEAEADPAPEPAYPTVVLQARRNMQKFDNCVLLTRVGGFYELYFEHAEVYGPHLNLKVASKKTSAGPVPMV